MTNSELRGDPAADARSDQIKGCQLEGIEDFQIVKDHVLNRIDIFVLVGACAARVRGSDEPRALRKFFMKWQPNFFYRMHIGKAMQMKQRGTLAAFEEITWRPQTSMTARLMHSLRRDRLDF